MNRKVVLVTSVLAALSALTGCRVAEVTEEEHEPKIFGATYMTRNNPYFDVLHEAIENVVEGNGDIVISVTRVRIRRSRMTRSWRCWMRGLRSFF